MKELICIHQRDHINNLLAITYFKPEKVTILDFGKSDQASLNHIVQFIEKEKFRIPVEVIEFLSEKKALGESLKLEEKLDAIFILPEDASFLGYQFTVKLIQENSPMAYVDNDGNIHRFMNGRFEMVESKYSVNISDYINSRGGIITSESTDIFNHHCMIHLLDFIEGNYKAYLDLFRYARKKKPFYKSYPDNRNKLIIEPFQLEEAQQEFLNKLMRVLESQKIVKYIKQVDQQYILMFKHKSYKSYLLKTGTWLEHRLYLLFKEIGVDDVEASLSFLWDKKRKANNECDVVGVNNNRLIVASCKDTHHISPEYINEIYTNAIHLGGEESVKMLFTTADIPFGIQEKADEFDVIVVKYDFDKNRIAEKLKKVV